MQGSPATLALIASVELEIAPLRRRMHHMSNSTIGRKPAVRGLLAGVPVVVIESGMGKTNAAHALTALLEREAVAGVIGFGVGGAYPGSGLAVGDIALATAEIFGDTGVEAPQGWLSTQDMAIPLLRLEGAEYYNDFPLHSEQLRAASVALDAAGIVHRRGPFVTVSNCSGTESRGRQLADRFGGMVESMEGAACAHLCRLYDTPFVEVRGISNLVEDRDLSGWRLSEAAERCAEAVERIVGAWPGPGSTTIGDPAEATTPAAAQEASGT